MKSTLPEFDSSIFPLMTPFAKEHNAINLSQGFAEFDANPKLLELINKYYSGGTNAYAPMPGLPLLRERLAQKYATLHGHEYNWKTEITITSGATQAIYCAITAAVHPGDEVIVLEPVFDTYVPGIQLCGAKAVPVQMKAPAFLPDWEEVEAAITDKTRMIIINSPHNPSGSVLSRDDMLRLEVLLEKHDLLLLSDEVHEHVFYEKEHQSVAAYEGLRKRAFLVGSFGKTYHGTGWKIGYCMSPAAMNKEFLKIHQNVVFASNHPMQHALAEYMQDPQTYLQLPDFFRAKRDFFLKGIENSRFKFYPTEGTFFQMLDY